MRLCDVSVSLLKRLHGGYVRSHALFWKLIVILSLRACMKGDFFSVWACNRGYHGFLFVVVGSACAPPNPPSRLFFHRQLDDGADSRQMWKCTFLFSALVNGEVI
jgi:hypothetical protein